MCWIIKTLYVIKRQFFTYLYHLMDTTHFVDTVSFWNITLFDSALITKSITTNPIKRNPHFLISRILLRKSVEIFIYWSGHLSSISCRRRTHPPFFRPISLFSANLIIFYSANNLLHFFFILLKPKRVYIRSTKTSREKKINNTQKNINTSRFHYR